MSERMGETAIRPFALRFHAQRNPLLAEAHARPSTPLEAPTLASRIAALTGEGALDRDWEHMVALCRRLGAPEPSPGARWCVLDAGAWRLRWERHTEVSTWTFYRPIADDHVPRLDETALDLVPVDWLSGLPGDVLVAAHIALLRSRPANASLPAEDEIASEIADGAAQVFTDFRAGRDSFTRILVVQKKPDAALAGRIVQQLFEIESYRLMALLAFPLAGEAGRALSRMETEAAAAAMLVREEGSIEADRALLNRLAALAAEAQALAGRTSFRFAAARAYYGLVLERVRQLREHRLDGRPTIDEFMERRLAPAMRTCQAVTERQQAVIDHIARTSQLLNTRVEVAAEITNASLLASMDRRAKQQLRLQQAVEGFSMVAITYYVVGLIGYLLQLWSHYDHTIDKPFWQGVSAPIVFGAVFLMLRFLRERLGLDESETTRH